MDTKEKTYAKRSLSFRDERIKKILTRVKIHTRSHICAHKHCGRIVNSSSNSETVAMAMPTTTATAAAKYAKQQKLSIKNMIVINDTKKSGPNSTHTLTQPMNKHAIKWFSEQMKYTNK